LRDTAPDVVYVLSKLVRIRTLNLVKQRCDFDFEEYLVSRRRDDLIVLPEFRYILFTH